MIGSTLDSMAWKTLEITSVSPSRSEIPKSPMESPISDNLSENSPDSIIARPKSREGFYSSSPGIFNLKIFNIFFHDEK